jgi:putative colanic acid biosynthesis UDP-glucose lipid carrier transferase
MLRHGSRPAEREAAAPRAELLTHKNNLASLLQATRFLAPLLIVPLTLLLSTVFLLEPFDDAYLLLAFVAGALAHIILSPSFREGEFEARDVAAVGQVLIGWSLIIALLLLVGYAAKVSTFFSRRVLFCWFVVGAVGLVIAHTVIRQFARRVMSLPEMARTVVIAGVNDISARLATEILGHPELGMQLKGFFEDRGPDRFAAGISGEVIGKLADLPAYVKQRKTDVIFIALPIRHVKRVLDLLDELYDTTASIYFIPDVFVFDLIQSRTHNICGLPAISLCETPFYGYRGLAKRVMDVALSSLGLIMLLPLLLAIAIAIRLGSPGTVIFRQRRYGLDGGEITVYKFRTMYVSEDSDAVMQATRGDARVTPIGRFLRKYSLDELPQLVNVIQGRMSLVGPRPHAIAHNEQYRKLIKGYMIRHKVLPGITGWAQVNGFRGETTELEDMRARVECDLDYLRNWSLAMDLKILFMTLWTVLNTEKAY